VQATVLWKSLRPRDKTGGYQRQLMEKSAARQTGCLFSSCRFEAAGGGADTCVGAEFTNAAVGRRRPGTCKKLTRTDQTMLYLQIYSAGACMSPTACKKCSYFRNRSAMVLSLMLTAETAGTKPKADTCWAKPHRPPRQSYLGMMVTGRPKSRQCWQLCMDRCLCCAFSPNRTS
jgi:hypothetical protein